MTRFSSVAADPAGIPDAVNERPARPSLRRLAVSGTLWSVGGNAGGQAIRLAGNLVLTRLLFPEAFGLMALVQVVLRGLEMFSDVGLQGSVIRDKRGDDPAFLNTAWTIQLVRSAGLWLAASILAWPASLLYGEPLLAWMIPVAALGTLVRGGQSIAALTLRRHVKLKPLVLRDLAASLLGLGVTVALALMFRSVWALVIGGVVRAVVFTALSYVLLPGPRPQLAWDRDAAREMYRFGRWIFVSTALTFLLQQGDKAILGGFVSAEALGIFAIAAMLSRAALEVLLKLNSNVMFPIYARIANEERDRLRPRLFRARLTLLAAFLPPLWALVIWGEPMIRFLYDPRYADAGWMLQVLSAGIIGSVITTTSGNVLLAVGDSLRFMLLQVYRSVALIAGMVVGGLVAGLPGLVVGITLSKLIDYPVLVWAVRRYGAWLPGLDTAAYAASIFVVGLGLWLRAL